MKLRLLAALCMAVLIVSGCAPATHGTGVAGQLQALEHARSGFNTATSLVKAGYPLLKHAGISDEEIAAARKAHDAYVAGTLALFEAIRARLEREAEEGAASPASPAGP